MPDTLMTIRSIKDQLPKSEQKVADYVLKNPETVIASTIIEVAEGAQTSEPTVIRFCRSLGLQGFMDLKLNLAKNLPASEYVHEKVNEHDSLADIYNKIFSSAKEAINTTMNTLEMDTLASACKILATANRIDFYGVGGSGVVARDAYHKFFRLGIPCNVHDDPHMQVMSAALLSDRDVVIAISHTGSTKDIIDSITIARTKGATVIGILGKKKSPIAKFCHIVISVGSQEAALRYAPMNSRIAQLIVIDVLFVAVAMRHFYQTNKLLDDVKRALMDKRY